jgi:hypothetical protein
VQLLVKTDGPAGKRQQRIVTPIANVTVRSESEIHRPDEDRAMVGFEGCVEVHIVPENGADPHEPQPLSGTCGNVVFDACLDFIAKPFRVGDGPFRAAEPLSRLFSPWLRGACRDLLEIVIRPGRR